MRIKRISPDEMNAEQKEVYDANVASKRGRMPAPVHAWIRSPRMAKRMEPLGEFLRYDSELARGYQKLRSSSARGTGPRISNGMRTSVSASRLA